MSTTQSCSITWPGIWLSDVLGGLDGVECAADAFMLAFHSAVDAVMYCLTVQKVRLASNLFFFRDSNASANNLAWCHNFPLQESLHQSHFHGTANLSHEEHSCISQIPDLWQIFVKLPRLFTL